MLLNSRSQRLAIAAAIVVAGIIFLYTISTITAANAPSGLTATAGDTQVTLGWDNPNDSSITGYQVLQVGISKLVVPNTATDPIGAGDRFGDAVGVDNNRAAVGAPFQDPLDGSITLTDAGQVHMFFRGSGGWSHVTQRAFIGVSDDDNTGASVAVDGRTVVAGVPEYDYPVSNSVTHFDIGRMIVYYNDPGLGWGYNADPRGEAARDQFGNSVSVDDATAVVGAPHHDIGTKGNAGSAYVYTRNSDDLYADWSQKAKLTASDSGANDRLGTAVAMDGNTVVVGAEGDDNNRGSAYVFIKPSGNWANAIQTAKLTAPGGASDDAFGSAAAVDGDFIVVGARGDDDDASQSGSVYVFTKPNTTDGWGDWDGLSSTAKDALTAKLTASDAAMNDRLGWSVAVDGDTVLAGAYWEDAKGANSGSVYLFTKPSGSWVDATETVKLIAPDGAAGDEFGYSVAAGGGTAIVGAPGDESETGAAYVFSIPGWTDISGSGAGTTSHTVTGLTNGVEHTFLIRPVVGSNPGPKSGNIKATPMPSPAAPTNLAAVLGDGEVVLTWTNPTDSSITKYQYSTNGGTSFTDIGGSGAATTAYVVTGLTNGAQYTLAVRAVNVYGAGTASTVSATPTAPPTVPVYLSNMGQTTSLVYFADLSSAQAQSFSTGANALGYLFGSIDVYFERAPGSGTLTVSVRNTNASGQPGSTVHTLTNPTTVGTGIQRFTAPADAQLDANINYFLHVTFSGSGTTPRLLTTESDTLDSGTATGWNMNDFSYYSSGANWFASSNALKVSINNVSNPPALPTAPTGLTAVPGDGQVGLSWADPGNETIAKYQVSSDGGANFTDIGSSDKDTTGTTVTGLTNGTEYTLSVRAVNISGDGASSSVTATPNNAPAAVDDTGATNEDTAVDINVVANDTDAEGDTLSVSAVGTGDDGPSNGTAALTSGSTTEVTYTPNPNFSGQDSFTYTVSDGTLTGPDPGTVTVTVTAVNDAPAAVDDTGATNEDTAVDINVVANDTDAEGDTLSVSAVGTGDDGPSNGTAALTSGSTTEVTYTPNPNFSGQDSFTYTVSDGTLTGPDPGTVTVTVTAVNDAPVAVDDTLTVSEDASATSINVVANDTDAEGDTLSVSAVGTGDDGPSNGTAALTSGSRTEVTYTPNPNFSGQDSFTYTVSDGTLTGPDPGTVTVTVTAVNDAPAAVDDTGATNEDTAVDINVVANDTDAEGDTLSVSAVGTGDDGPSNGTAALTSGSTTEVTYTPNPNFSGQDSFTYTVSDGTLTGPDPGTVTVTVTAVNDAPVAVDDTLTVSEDASATSLNVITNDTDAEGDTLSVSAVGTGDDGPSNGTAALTSGSRTEVTYTPNPNFSGQDSFTYTVSDGTLTGPDPGTVTVTVTAVNDAPAAVDDTGATNEDTAVDINVVANDTDAEGDTLSVSAVGTGDDGPSNGTAALTSGSTTEVTYTPNPNFSGQDSFTYTVSDGTLTGPDPGTVTVTVTAVNDAPVAVDDTLTVSEDASATSLNVITNDTDAEGDTLSVSAVGTGDDGPSNGTAALTSGSTTEVSYTPNPNFSGQDSFTYTVSDGTLTGPDPGTVTVTVTAVNDAPAAVDDTGATNEDTAVDINVVANDTDAEGDTLSVSAVGTGDDGPSNGTAALTSGSTTEVTYTPNPNFSGQDSFTYTVSDGTLTGPDPGTVTVTVTAVNDAPAAVDDTGATNEDTAVDINVVANDTDAEGDTLSVSAVGTGDDGPSNGTAALTSGSRTEVTYTPNPNFSGQDSFTYTVSDGTLTGPDPGTVTVTVTAVNDAPAAVDDTLTVSEDASATSLNVITNDTDAEGDTLSVSAVGTGDDGPSNGTAALTSGSRTEVTYTPNPNFSGQDSFTYTVSDGTLTGPDPGTVTVTVTAVNDAPAAVDDTGATNEDTAVDINVVANDTDAEGDTLSVSAVGTGDDGPSNGTAALTSGSTTEVTYTPNPNFSGQDSFTYTVADGTLTGPDPGTVTVTVTAVNDAPAAVDDTGATNEDTAVDINVVANDTDAEGDTLSVSAVGTGDDGPSNGTAALTSGSRTEVTYTPNPNFSGQDSFTYTVADGTLTGPDPGTVTVTVTAVNDAPAAVDDTGATNEDTAVDINVVANDTDAEGDTLSVSAVGTGDDGPSNGTAALMSGSTTEVTYTPNPNFSGQDSFTYTVSDGTLTGPDPGTVTVTVTAVNDAPAAVDDTGATNEDTAVDINVVANDTDAEGDTLSVSAVGTGDDGPSNGTAALTSGSTTEVTYTPNPNFSGQDSFTYTVSDGTLTGPDPGTVTVTVTAVNDAPGGGSGTVTEVNSAPVANDDALTVYEDASATSLNVITNDTDAEGDTLSVSAVGTGDDGPSNGTAALTSGSTTEVTYTPNPNFSGQDSFTYTVSDGTLTGPDPGTVTVTVTAVNDAPAAVDDTGATNEDTAVDINVVANDTDAEGDTLSVSAVGTGDDGPSNGTAALTSGSTTEVTYTPNPNFSGQDSFTYTVSDGTLTGPDPGTVTVTVTAVNDAPGGGSGTVTVVNSAPVANDDALTVYEDASATSLNVITNDMDAEGDTLSVSAVGTGDDGPSNGTAALTSGSTTEVTYTPNPNFSGQDSFTYTVSDGTLTGPDPGTVTVTVTAVNDAPVAVDDTGATNEDTAVDINVVANDTDAEGDTLSVSAVGTGDDGPSNGTAALTSGSTTEVTYTPNPNFSGQDSFTYTVADGNGGTDSGKVTVTMTAVAEPAIIPVPGAIVVYPGQETRIMSPDGGVMLVFPAYSRSVVFQVRLTAGRDDCTITDDLAMRVYECAMVEMFNVSGNPEEHVELDNAALMLFNLDANEVSGLDGQTTLMGAMEEDRIKILRKEKLVALWISVALEPSIENDGRMSFRISVKDFSYFMLGIEMKSPLVTTPVPMPEPASTRELTVTPQPNLEATADAPTPAATPALEPVSSEADGGDGGFPWWALVLVVVVVAGVVLIVGVLRRR